MSEIDDLLRISNRGHKRMSGAAKFFWVFFILGNAGLGVLIILAILAAIFHR
jgi:hypothetical protein